MVFSNNMRYYTTLVTYQLVQLNYKEMKRTYISNTYWHTDSLIIGGYSSRESHWEIVDEDYIYTKENSLDVRTYKIIRDEK